MLELPETYLICGPDDHNQLVTFWNVEREGWVGIELASRFDARILTAPLPPRAGFIMDVSDAECLTTFTPEGGEGLENS